MRLFWSAHALNDRRDIYSHIEADDPAAAIAVDARIDAAAQRLLDFPLSGRPGRVPGTRELVIGRTPFVAPYLISGDSVRILRVLHGARIWPEQMGGRADL